MIRATGHLLNIYAQTRVDALGADPGGNPDHHALQAVLDIVAGQERAQVLKEIRELAADSAMFCTRLDLHPDNLASLKPGPLLRLLAATDGPLAHTPAKLRCGTCDDQGGCPDCRPGPAPEIYCAEPTCPRYGLTVLGEGTCPAGHADLRHPRTPLPPTNPAPQANH